MLLNYSRKFYFVLILIIVGSGVIISQNNKKTFYYTGLINEKYKIMTKLTYENFKATGDYFYITQGSEIFLSGDYDKAGNITLNEEFYDRTTGDSKTTGIFKGKSEDKFITLKGEWANPKGTKKMPFYLKSIATEKKIEMKDFQIYVAFPELTTGKNAKEFNKEIEKYMKMQLDSLNDRINREYKEAEDSEMKKEIKEKYSYTIDSHIEYASDAVMSIVLMNYEYTGGAHPSYYFTSLNLAMISGKIVYLKLSDIFKPNSNYLKILSDLCIAELKKQKASSILSGDITDVTNEISDGAAAFSILEKGLRFDFSPYAVGAYAEGSFVCTIPFEKIKNILKTESALGDISK